MQGDEVNQTKRFTITNSEKILLHLSDFYRYENEYRVPHEISQSGIARTIGIRRCNVARELIKLKDKGFTKEKLVHFEGIKRRKKGYFLTQLGFGLAANIKDYVNESRIIVKDENGKTSEMMISDVKKMIGRDLLLAEMVAKISNEGVFDVRSLEEEITEEPLPEELYTSRFVGRESELEHIQNMYLETFKGKGKCLLISGEAGIGKTRLVNEVRKRLTAKDFYFLQGSCLYQTAVDPYLPFVEALGDYLRVADKSVTDSTMVELESTAPEFVELMPMDHAAGEARIPFLAGDINLNSERTRIFDTISKTLTRIAKEKPVVLFIDDLHWADVGSIHLLHYLARNVREDPILILGAYRPEDLVDLDNKPHPLKETISRLRVENIVEEIELRRLEFAESKKMVGAHLDKREPVSEELATLIHKETDGNPFFIEEIMSTLDKGTINRPPQKIDIPRSIRDTIMRRVDSLDHLGKTILEVCSIIGDRFDIDVLMSVMSEDEGDILDSIDDLCQARLIEDDLSGHTEGYRFHHCKIQEVVYYNLNRPRRRMLHGRICEILEDLYRDDISEVASELAYHYSNTKDYEKTYEYSWAAGKKASDVFSYDEAISHFMTALRALRNIIESGKSMTPGTSDSEDFELEFVLSLKDGDIKLIEKAVLALERMGDAYYILGKWDEGLIVYTKALDLAIDNKMKGYLASRLGHIYRRKGLMDEGISICNQGLNIVLEENKERCHLLTCLGDIYSDISDFENALEYYSASQEIAERIGNEQVLATIFDKTGVIFDVKCENEKALEYYNRSLAIREREGDESGVSALYNNLGCLYGRMGYYNRALDYFEKSVVLRKKIGNKAEVSSTYINIGTVHFLTEDYDKALDYFERSLVIKDSIDDPYGKAAIWTYFGQIHTIRREYDIAEKYYNEAIETAERIGQKHLLSYTYCGLAENVLMRSNDFGYALELANKAFDISKEVGLKGIAGFCYRLFGLIYKAQKNWDMAIKRYNEAIKNRKESGELDYLGETYYEFAQLWTEKGDIYNAKKYLELALQIFEERNLKRKVERVRNKLKDLEQLEIK